VGGASSTPTSLWHATSAAQRVCWTAGSWESDVDEDGRLKRALLAAIKVGRLRDMP
jgi:hypothetical protein